MNRSSQISLNQLIGMNRRQLSLTQSEPDSDLMQGKFIRFKKSSVGFCCLYEIVYVPIICILNNHFIQKNIFFLRPNV